MQRRPSVLLWGAGMAAGVHAAACRDLGWHIEAVASRTGDRAEALARRLRSRPVTFPEALSKAIAQIAIVTTPPSAHVDDAVRLLTAGYDVVVESPIACTLDEADRLVAAASDSGQSMLYSEHLTSMPTIASLLARVPQVGPVTHLSARAVQSPSSWRGSTTDQWGGGSLFDPGVHPIALVLRTAQVAELGQPVSVRATLAADTTGVEPVERGTVWIRFASGIVATVSVGLQPHSAPDWDLQVSSSRAVLRADLYPAPTLEYNGDIVVGDRGPLDTARSTASTDDASQVQLVGDYGYSSQLRIFWGDIRTGRQAPSTVDFGRRVLEVVCAAHWSVGSNTADVALPFSGPHDLTPTDLQRAAHR